MASALGKSGSTRRWKNIRAEWQARLVGSGGAPCWRCGKWIQPTEPWVLGHVKARALGGGDDQLAYEHRRCSDVSGGQLSQALQRGGTIRMIGEYPGQLFGTAVVDLPGAGGEMETMVIERPDQPLPPDATAARLSSEPPPAPTTARWPVNPLGRLGFPRKT